ncbi:hypothetical protein D3C81_1638140 [compost metagenome]
MEAHLRGTSKKLTKLRRVLKARKLNNDTIGTDALNRWFGNADLIYTLADDFKALLKSRVQTIVEARFCQCQTNLIVTGSDVDIVDRCTEAAGIDL